MRILFLTPFLPDPQSPHGGGAYLGQLLAALGRHCELGVLATPTEEEMGRWPAASAAWTWREAVVARPRGRGLQRVLHTLRMAWRWRTLPLVAAKAQQGGIAAALVRAHAQFRPDAVCVELAQMAQYLPLLRDVPTVLTDHEAGCPANTTTGLGAWGDRRDRRLWQHFVQRFYPRADLLQAVTQEDADALHAALQRAVAVRPPVVAAADRPVAPAAAPPTALFLGDYRHAPNVEAATRLAREILPLVRNAVPAAELLLAGAASERITALAAQPGVRVVGYAPDLGALFAQARLLVAPVWSGGGFRMKGVTALAYGLPVVTNSLGARGCAAPAAARQIAETAADLAEAAVRWLRDPAAAAAAGRAAHDWIRNHLSPDTVAQQQLERVRALLGTRR